MMQAQPQVVQGQVVQGQQMGVGMQQPMGMGMQQPMGMQGQMMQVQPQVVQGTQPQVVTQPQGSVEIKQPGSSFPVVYAPVKPSGGMQANKGGFLGFCCCCCCCFFIIVLIIALGTTMSCDDDANNFGCGLNSTTGEPLFSQCCLYGEWYDDIYASGANLANHSCSCECEECYVGLYCETYDESIPGCEQESSSSSSSSSSCMAPGTSVIAAAADGSWAAVPVEDVKLGDVLMGGGRVLVTMQVCSLQVYMHAVEEHT